MKSKALILLLLCIYLLIVRLYAVSPDKGKITFNKHPGKKRAGCTATLSGNTCVGSVLTVSSSEPVASISWQLNGASILDQDIAQQNNGVVVAGGNGAGAGTSQLNSPNRLFVDAEGNLYIPDMGNNRVQKWAPGAASGVTVAGGNGAGSQANQFNRPTAVAVDAAGNIYVADQNNGRIQKWAPGATSGVTVAASLSLPTGLFIDPNGNLFVSQQNDQSILKFPAGGGTGILVAGGNGYGSAPNQLASPTGIFVDAAENIYICDTDNGRVQKWARGATNGITVAISNGSIFLNNPLAVFVDGMGNIYVSDQTGFSVQKWTPLFTGTIIAGGNGQGTNPNQITPAGVWMDAHNNLYVSDFSSNRVIKFGNIYTGTFTTVLPGTYTAKIITKTGCETVSNPIVVAENKIADISISSSSNTACISFQPAFTATVTNGGTSPVFKWKVNGSDANGGTNSSTFSGTGLVAGDVVTCGLTSNEVCVQNAIVWSNPITMLAPEQSLNPLVTISADQNLVCSGTRITFTAQVENTGTSPSYVWKVNGSAVPDGPDGAVYETDELHDLDEISCTVKSDASYCQQLSNVTSDRFVVRINPNLTPGLTIVQDLTKIYKGLAVTFQANVVNGGVNPVFDWQINGRSVGVSQPVFTTTDLTDGDEVSCNMIADLVCTHNALAVSNSIFVKVITLTKILPPTAFSPNGDGINDHWQITGISSFPNCVVQIFNSYGTEVFKSIGYKKAWEGDYNGKICDPSVFYYIINLDYKQIISGSVMIIR
ncbi:MAG TPA: gliding motility-associated C-terminal domain-containing protein [Pedobacter sp.]|uniref:T9SS type B sorting domain-containing protein n=1 Tax=Pedobacter sp. TaxID=1411316 RepID=UPI002CCB8766|nr:gliding motility-associated C-terminal domain-containing protein [Pedobacter sp.]HMI02062.1 gliding motility-associated C-terminal domain-containing protein [Pedobacter sp.]